MGQNVSVESSSDYSNTSGERQGMSTVDSFPTLYGNHHLFSANGDLEHSLDFDSLLETVSIIPKTPESENPTPTYNEVIEVEGLNAQHEAIQKVVKARSSKFIHHLSDCYPEQEGDLLSKIRVSTMMEVASYCDVRMQNLLATVNKYFNQLIHITRTEASITCNPDWVKAINRSPFLHQITLYKGSAPEDTKRFCKIVKNDGFTELTDLNLVYMDDEATKSILAAFNTKISRSLRLSIINRNFTAGIYICCYDISQEVSYAFAEAAQESLCKVLGRLRIETGDLDGIENFFKTVDFSNFNKLYQIVLSGCPLQRRGFERFIRSLWPEGVSAGDLPPVRILRLNDVQLHNSGVLSMSQVMKRGLFINLEEFDISSNKLGEKGVSLLAECFQNFCVPNLKRLYLTDNFVSVGHLVPLFQALAGGSCPLLAELEFGHTGIGEADMEAFAAYLNSPYCENLTRLNLSNNPQVTPALPRFFRALREGECSRLSTLFMEGVSLSLKEVEEFLPWLLSPKSRFLKALILKSNLLDAEAFRMLLHTLINPQCPRLSILDFSSNLIGGFDESSWLSLLAEDGETVLFEQINFSFNPLTDNDMRLFLMFISRFSKPERMARVTFADNQISCETLSFFFKTLPEEMCSLYYLVIDSCSVQNCGRYLSDFLTSAAARNLECLSLRDCALSKFDLLDLLTSLDSGVCTKLTTLRLDGNSEIGNYFIQKLLEVISKNTVPNLSRIDLGYTQINGAGVALLVDYFKEHENLKLRTVDLTSIMLSSEERDGFKEEISKCFHGHVLF